jgi:tetratricopeptide (TPR) repeat protein
MTGPGAGGGEELVRRAKTLLELGRFEDGSRLLRQALAADPSDAGTWCDLAQALVEAAQPGPALEAARSAIALEPELARAHRIGAWALLGLNRALDALPAAREAVRLEPESHNLWVLTEAELRCGQKDRAEETARRALDLAPDQAMSHVMMADVSAARRRWKESEVHARRALTIDPENTLAMQTLARAVSFRGRLWQAVQHQDRAARLEPGEPGARQQVASGLLILAGVSLFATLMAFGFRSAW